MNTIPRRPIRHICGVNEPTRHFSYSEIRNTDPRLSSHILRYNQALGALALDPTYSGLDRGSGGTTTGAGSLDVTGSTRLGRPAIGSFTCCGSGCTAQPFCMHTRMEDLLALYHASITIGSSAVVQYGIATTLKSQGMVHAPIHVCIRSWRCTRPCNAQVIAIRV